MSEKKKEGCGPSRHGSHRAGHRNNAVAIVFAIAVFLGLWSFNHFYDSQGLFILFLPPIGLPALFVFVALLLALRRGVPEFKWWYMATIASLVWTLAAISWLGVHTIAVARCAADAKRICYVPLSGTRVRTELPGRYDPYNVSVSFYDSRTASVILEEYVRHYEQREWQTESTGGSDPSMDRHPYFPYKFARFSHTKRKALTVMVYDNVPIPALKHMRLVNVYWERDGRGARRWKWM